MIETRHDRSLAAVGFFLALFIGFALPRAGRNNIGPLNGPWPLTSRVPVGGLRRAEEKEESANRGGLRNHSTGPANMPAPGVISASNERYPNRDGNTKHPKNQKGPTEAAKMESAAARHRIQRRSYPQGGFEPPTPRLVGECSIR